jgi:hypothetical protein
MKTVLHIASISLLLGWGISSAHANGPHYEWRTDLRAAYQQQHPQPQPARDHDTGSQQRNDVYTGMAGSADVPPNSGTNDEVKKPGKMTPEERRALRRQINEAGRDIYAPPQR